MQYNLGDEYGWSSRYYANLSFEYDYIQVASKLGELQVLYEIYIFDCMQQPPAKAKLPFMCSCLQKKLGSTTYRPS